MVYFISESGTKNVKIGYTRDDIFGRLQTLQTGNCRKLTLIGLIRDGTMKDETLLHKRFKNSWINLEWFEVKEGSDLLTYINSISDSHVDVVNDKVQTYKKMKM